MKNLLTILFAVVALAACEPKEKVNPTAQIYGKYELTVVKLNNVKVENIITGYFTIAKASEGFAQVTFKGKIDNNDEYLDFGKLEVKPNKSDYDFYQDGARVGRVSGQNFTLFYDDNSDTFELVSKKVN
jgi:hypothetical protein